MSSIGQISNPPPAQPVYVLRGHSSQVHALHFLQANLRLLSGDADGWVILWDMTTKRPMAVWKPHSGPILGLGSWDDQQIITHGRDNKLYVWKFTRNGESTFSTTLPIEDAISERKQPWLLHSLDVNALNFCSFAMCRYFQRGTGSDSAHGEAAILIATPGAQDGHINVTSLPGEDRVATIPNPPNTATGMIMATGLHFANDELTVLAGYESGHAAVWRQSGGLTKEWQVVYMNKSHTQPILSLDVVPDGSFFFTSSADAIIGRHPLLAGSCSQAKTSQTRHAGQQSLTIRSSGDIFATAGWDGRVRAYSVESMKELAVLKWHKEGCYATAFAEVADSTSVAKEAVKSEGELIKRELTVSERRTETVKATHWLAAGSKDGKISLWNIY